MHSIIRLFPAFLAALTLAGPLGAQTSAAGAALADALQLADQQNWDAAEASAQQAGPLGPEIIEWDRLRGGDGAFSDYVTFLRRHPDWPGLSYLRLKGEATITAAVPVADVLAGIEAAQAVGLKDIKVNMVVKRGTNEDQILPMARHFKGTGISLRFIEYMDVGATNGWRMDEVMPSADVIRLLQSVWPLQPLAASAPGETAQRWAYQDGGGEVGVISSVTQAFCHECNRARLSIEGQVYLCLFAQHGYDLKPLLRGDACDEDIAGVIGQIWQGRSDRYSELRSSLAPDTTGSARRVEMSYIGG